MKKVITFSYSADRDLPENAISGGYSMWLWYEKRLVDERDDVIRGVDLNFFFTFYTSAVDKVKLIFLTKHVSRHQIIHYSSSYPSSGGLPFL